MKVFFDTEFMENGKTIELLSIGMVREDGHELYLVNESADTRKANDWVRANVLPHLYETKPLGITPARKPLVLREEVRFFCAPPGTNPEFWGYYCDYDWVVLCQLFGTMMDLPEGWPYYCLDLRQSLDERALQHIKQPDDASHNALSDARWVANTHKALVTGVLK